MMPVLERSEGNVSLKVFVDEDPQNCRDWDNLGTILYASSRYTLGDKRVSAEEIEEITSSDDYLWLPVFAYIHSGIVLGTGDFGDPWDSGQSGIIYASKAAVLKAFMVDSLTDEIRAKALACLKGEIESYSDYLQGNVYGWVTEVDGEQVDSCWGYYGDPKDLIDENWADAIEAGKEADKAKRAELDQKTKAVKAIVGAMIPNAIDAWIANPDGSARVTLVDGRIVTVRAEWEA